MLPSSSLFVCFDDLEGTWKYRFWHGAPFRILSSLEFENGLDKKKLLKSKLCDCLEWMLYEIIFWARLKAKSRNLKVYHRIYGYATAVIVNNKKKMDLWSTKVSPRSLINCAGSTHCMGIVCNYLVSLAPLSWLQAQAARGGGADRGVFGGLGETRNKSCRVRTSGGLM